MSKRILVVEDQADNRRCEMSARQRRIMLSNDPNSDQCKTVLSFKS
jgi:hypothetical protein